MERQRGGTPLDIKLNDLYSHKHAKGNRGSSPLPIGASFQISCRRSRCCSSETSSPTAPGGGRNASGVVRAEQVPPSVSPSDAALPPPAPPQGKDAARGAASPTLAPGLFTCCVGEIIQRGAHGCCGGCRGQVPCVGLLLRRPGSSAGLRYTPTLWHPTKLETRR